MLHTPPIVYAVGDIHGRVDLLDRLQALIRLDRLKHHRGRPATIVYLGDYVDRGPDSDQVIDCLMGGLEGFETVCLMGNHEDMMLDCLDTNDSTVWSRWLGNGGVETMAAFGINLLTLRGRGPVTGDDLRGVLGDAREEWLRGLRLSYEVPGYIFVHAGIVPGVPLPAQKRKDLLWIREAFLNSDADHGAVVVHGHTISDQPHVLENRIGLDTGAFLTGVLSAAVLAPGEAPRIIQT